VAAISRHASNTDSASRWDNVECRPMARNSHGDSDLTKFARSSASSALFFKHRETIASSFLSLRGEIDAPRPPHSILTKHNVASLSSRVWIIKYYVKTDMWQHVVISFFIVLSRLILRFLSSTINWTLVSSIQEYTCKRIKIHVMHTCNFYGSVYALVNRRETLLVKISKRDL